MSDRKVRDSLANLRRAIDRLEEALAIEPNRALVMEGTIHRFEMATELTWKTIQRALHFEGVKCGTPRETLRAAHKIGWISAEGPWLAMVQRRNETSHEYLADEIVQQNYGAAADAFPHMKEMLEFLSKRYE